MCGVIFFLLIGLQLFLMYLVRLYQNQDEYSKDNVLISLMNSASETIQNNPILHHLLVIIFVAVACAMIYYIIIETRKSHKNAANGHVHTASCSHQNTVKNK
eukprot:TRINITY_DN4845_c0_g1_i3.p1 TRINITY_DN4845_c0_g1~~TRINITY_DN4845_c0_g1_i3.p1  ORF type:complete len:102 (-),score=11.30 TRINITY_DN4845_c0_g1_i3:93-398(-)